MSIKPSNAAVVDVCTKRVRALKTYVGNKGTIPMNGKDLKISDVVGIYQSCLDTRATLATKRTEVKAALAAKTSAESARVAADAALNAWLITKFGAGSQQALDFGFAPRKTGERTVDEKAKAKALALATRKARNTMGKKQKKSIKGSLVVPTAPAAPATNTPAGASPAGQPAVVVVQATPAQQTQTLNGASTPAAAASVTPASH